MLRLKRLPLPLKDEERALLTLLQGSVGPQTEEQLRSAAVHAGASQHAGEHAGRAMADVTPTHAQVTLMVGVSGRYPGPGEGIQGFWQGLSQGLDMPLSVPHQRWDLDRYYVPEARGDLTMYARHAAFIQGLDSFDAALFRCAARPNNLLPSSLLLASTQCRS